MTSTPYPQSPKRKGMRSLPDVPDDLRKYVRKNKTINEEKHSRQLEQLANFQKNTEAHLRHSRKHREFNTPDKKKVPVNLFMRYAGLFAVANELSFEIYDYEEKNLRSIIEKTSKLSEALKAHDDYLVDVQNFTQDYKEDCTNDEGYRRPKAMRRQIKQRIKRFEPLHPQKNYKVMLKNEIFNVLPLYEEASMYSPPSAFDQTLGEYIFNSTLSDPCIACATVIAEGDPEPAIYTLGQFSLLVYENLSFTADNTQTVVYNSIVRILFDVAYISASELNKYHQMDAIFLQRCSEYSRQTVKDLQLSETLTRHYAPGLPVASLFKSKQVSLLKQMELMTNPIDLMKHVHTILGALAQYFGTEEGVLSFDDTLTLLLGLMIIGPPANAVSIAKFLDRWGGVEPSTIVGVAKNYFIAAVEQLMTPEEMENIP